MLRLASAPLAQPYIDRQLTASHCDNVLDWGRGVHVQLQGSRGGDGRPGDRWVYKGSLCDYIHR